MEDEKSTFQKQISSYLKINKQLTIGQELKFSSFNQFISNFQDKDSSKEATLPIKPLTSKIAFLKQKKEINIRFKTHQEYLKLTQQGLNIEKIYESLKDLETKSRKWMSKRVIRHRQETKDYVGNSWQYYDAFDHHEIIEELFPLFRLLFLRINPTGKVQKGQYNHIQKDLFIKYEMELMAYFILILMSLEKGQKLDKSHELIKNNLKFIYYWLLQQSEQLIKQQSENKIIFDLLISGYYNQDLIKAVFTIFKLKYSFNEFDKQKSKSVIERYNLIPNNNLWILQKSIISGFQEKQINSFYLLRTAHEHFIQIFCKFTKQESYWPQWKQSVSLLLQTIQKITQKKIITEDNTQATEFFINYTLFPKLFLDIHYFPCKVDKQFCKDMAQISQLKLANLICTKICSQNRIICYFYHENANEKDTLISNLQINYTKMIKFKKKIFQLNEPIEHRTKIIVVIFDNESFYFGENLTFQVEKDVIIDHLFHTFVHKLTQQIHAVKLSKRVPTFEILENIKDMIKISSEMTPEELKKIYFCLYVQKMQYLQTSTQNINEMRITYYVLDYLHKLDKPAWLDYERYEIQRLRLRIQAATGQSENLINQELQQYFDSQTQSYCLFWAFFQFNLNFIKFGKHPQADRILERQALLFELINIMHDTQSKLQIIRLQICFAALSWGQPLKKKKEKFEISEQIFQHQVARPYTIIASTIRCIINHLQSTFSNNKIKNNMKKRFCVIEPYTNRLRQLLQVLHPKNIPYPSQTMKDLQKKEMEQTNKYLRYFYKEFNCLADCQQCKDFGQNCYKQFTKLKQQIDICFLHADEDRIVPLYKDKMKQTYLQSSQQ